VVRIAGRANPDDATEDWITPFAGVGQALQQKAGA